MYVCVLCLCTQDDVRCTGNATRVCTLGALQPALSTTFTLRGTVGEDITSNVDITFNITVFVSSFLGGRVSATALIYFYFFCL